MPFLFLAPVIEGVRNRLKERSKISVMVSVILTNCAEPLLSGDNAAQRLGLIRDGFYYHVKILRKAVGLRHVGGTKKGRWEAEKS